MPTYRIQGQVKEDGSPAQHLVIALKANRADPATIGHELGRDTADVDGYYDIQFDDYTDHVAVVALDMSTGVTKQAEVIDWLTPVGVDVDPYFAGVQFLSHMEGSDGGTAFVDEKGHTINAVGGVTTSIEQAAFGSTSGKFWRYLGSRLHVPHHADFLVGSTNFTLEAEVYSYNLTQFSTLFSKRQVNPLGKEYDKGAWLVYISVDTLFAYLRNGERSWAGGSCGTVTADTWQHIAVSKYADSFKVFIEGQETGSFSCPFTIIDDTNDMYFGAENDGTNGLDGYMDEIRLTISNSRYNSTFQPPSTPHPDA